MSFKLANVDQIYEKDVKLKREDVKTIVEWLMTQPHLPSITEVQIILFLHSCYYDLEAAKTTIDHYFTIRTQHPDIFHSATDEVIRQTLSWGFVKVQPKRTPENYIILLHKPLDEKPENYNCINHTKLIIMVLTLYLHQAGPADGLLLLFDMKGCSLSHLFRISLRATRILLRYLQLASPVRLKGIHYINVNSWTHRMVSLVKPVTKAEIINLMHFHEMCSEEVYKHIPRDCLPKDLGGEGPSIENVFEEHVKYMLENKHFFKWHDSQKVEEQKRPRN